MDLTAESASQLVAGPSWILALFEASVSSGVESPKVAADLLLQDLPKITGARDEEEQDVAPIEGKLTPLTLRDLANAKSSVR